MNYCRMYGPITPSLELLVLLLLQRGLFYPIIDDSIYCMYAVEHFRFMVKLDKKTAIFFCSNAIKKLEKMP